MTGVPFPTGAGKGIFFLRDRVYTGCGDHPASCKIGTEGEAAGT